MRLSEGYNCKILTHKIKLSTTNTAIILLCIIFLFLRFFRLSELTNFTSDQGYLLLGAGQIIWERKISLIGPMVISKIVEGRGFFLGPLFYWFLVPLMVIAGFDPIKITWIFILLNLLAGLIIYKIGSDFFNKKVGLIAFSFFTFSPFFIEYSRFIWNPNLLALIGSGFLYALFSLNKKPTLLPFFLAGVLAGIGAGIHYSGLLLVLVFLMFITWKKLWKLKGVLLFFLGFLISSTPLLLFELRHNFYNIQTLFFIIRSGGLQSSENLTFQWHYFLVLAPAVLLLGAKIIERLFSFNRIVGLEFLVFLLVFFILRIDFLRNHGFTMPEGWNIKGVQKAAALIHQDQKGKNYNVASLLDGDTRALPFRFFLKTLGEEPLSVEDYPESQTLYVITPKMSKEQILQYPVWEIQTILPASFVWIREIQNEIYLYRLDRLEELASVI